MNLLCPNCQKMLTVPEQYAGQLMKCPLCTTNFTVPSLPGGGPSEPPAPASVPVAPPTGPDTYGVKNDPIPAFGAPPSPPPSQPSSAPAPPIPAFATGTPSTSQAPPPMPSSSSSSRTSPLPPPAAGEYTEGCRVTFDSQWLQFVPAAALVLVFILHFFPWVGVYYGGIEVTSQGAWSAATGMAGKPDTDMSQFFSFVKDAEAQEDFKDKNASGNDPQFSLLLFFYLIPLFFAGLAASIAVVALPHIKAPLPPQVQQVLPWKWAIVAGINGLLLLFVLLQFVLPFSLESRVTAYVNSDPSLRVEDKDKTDKAKEKSARRGMAIERVQRTMWFKLTILLHLLATAAAALVYWIEKRGPSKPMPALELRW